MRKKITDAEMKKKEDIETRMVETGIAMKKGREDTETVKIENIGINMTRKNDGMIGEIGMMKRIENIERVTTGEIVITEKSVMTGEVMMTEKTAVTDEIVMRERTEMKVTENTETVMIVSVDIEMKTKRTEAQKSEASTVIMMIEGIKTIESGSIKIEMDMMIEKGVAVKKT